MKVILFLALGIAPLGGAEHHGVVRFGGIPVPGATVSATQGDKRFDTITGQMGEYSLPDLDDGVWMVQVKMSCFAPLERDIAVAPSAPVPVWELRLLPRDEVHAERHGGPAPGGGSPDGSRSALAIVPSVKQPSYRRPTLPVSNTSTPFQRGDLKVLADASKLTADVGSQPQDLQSDAVDGLLINGSVNNGANSPFAQSPAFGNFRLNGRSPYSGTLSIMGNSSALDARPFSLTGQDTPKRGYKRLTGAASLGGPVRVPYLSSTNHAVMIFIGYQWTRDSNATTANAVMPDLRQRDGDFSHAKTLLGQLLQISDPANGAPFPGNVIPQGRISSQARYLLALYPVPGLNATTGYNYQIPLLNATHRDTFHLNLSRPIGSNSSLSGSFAVDSTRSDNPNIFGFLHVSQAHSVNVSAGWTYIFAPRLSGRFRARLSRPSWRSKPFFADRFNISSNAGITGNDQQPANWGPPTLSFSRGITSLSDAQSSFTRKQTTAWTYAIDWVRGEHNIKFGADYSRQQVNLLSQQNPRGSFGFTGAATGCDFADFLLGIPDTSSIAFGNSDKYFRSTTAAAYFNDDWRLGSGFSITVGMRWEYSAPFTERYGRLVNLDITQGFVAQAPVVASDPTGPLTGVRYLASLVRPDPRMLEPRVGLAWRSSRTGSLVVRSGYGISADTSVYEPIATQMAQQAPLSRSLSVQNSPINPLTLASGFNASPNITLNSFAIDPSFRVGYAQNWQLSIQHDLPGGMVVTASYLGIKGTHAQQAMYPNTHPAGGLNPCTACPSGFEYLTSGGNSTRHAGQIRLRRRLHSGLAATMEYTWAKAIDDATLGGGSQSTASVLAAQDWRNIRAERALSTFDQRQLLTAQFQYSTGMGVRGGTLLDGWRGSLFKNWTLTGQVTAGSGLPLTPIYPATTNGTGFSGSLRPDYTGAPLYAAPGSLFLNPAAYSEPLPGKWGSAGRNSIIGRPQLSLNSSLMRTFRLTDHINFDLRADVTNPINHVTFSRWDTNLNSALFGLPSSANSMRTAQINLRVRF